ncbi:flavodoxin domain-containing protein, partial [Bacillus sp. RHF6]
MGKILLVYATMSGNTEAMADLIEKGLQEAEAEADRFEAMDIDDAQLLNEYDHIIMGTYTWGDGDLPDEFLDLAEDMDEIDFSGKSCA